MEWNLNFSTITPWVRFWAQCQDLYIFILYYEKLSVKRLIRSVSIGLSKICNWQTPYYKVWTSKNAINSRSPNIYLCFDWNIRSFNILSWMIRWYVKHPCQTKIFRKNRWNRSELAQSHIFIQFGKKLSVINTIQFISLKWVRDWGWQKLFPYNISVGTKKIHKSTYLFRLKGNCVLLTLFT